MSSSPPSTPPVLPTDRDLDRLASAVRMAARDRDLPERVAEWYEDWIFLFVAWCLEAPPHQVHRDRIGDFWVALTEHPRVRRWKVCQAMDALGVLFGALGGPEALSFPGGTLPGAAPDSADGPPADDLEAPSHYLPDGKLPEAVEPRALVPTRTVRPEKGGEAPDRADETTTDEASPEDQAESAPKTLFNPTGGAPSRTSSTTSENPDSTPNTPDREAGDADRKAEDTTGNDAPDDLVSVEMPRDAARRLRDAARRLGVPTAVFAARAVDLLREETGVEEGQDLNTSVLLRRYQARIDLLHRHSLPDTSDDEAPLTVEVESSTDSNPQAGDETPAALDPWSGDGRPATAPTLDVNEG
jgi:hypothetical protein